MGCCIFLERKIEGSLFYDNPSVTGAIGIIAGIIAFISIFRQNNKIFFAAMAVLAVCWLRAVVAVFGVLKLGDLFQ